MQVYASRLFGRFYQPQLTGLILMTLLQRAPVLRLFVSAESVWFGTPLGQLLRSSAIVAASVGAVDTLAGATTFSANPTSPASATVGTAFNSVFAVTGAPGPIRSYTISNLPPGLNVTGAANNSGTWLLNTSTGQISGTPTTVGSYTSIITAWEKSGATGKNKAYGYAINVTGTSSPPPMMAPHFTAQPTSQSIMVGNSVTFSVTSSGTAPLSYQWQRNGSAIVGATGASYSIGSITMGNAGTYTVVVSNAAGSVTSNGATLTVNATPTSTSPAIGTQPTSQSIMVGNSVTFSVTSSGTAPLSYQWQRNGSAIVGATGASYSIGSITMGNAGTYTVVVSNAAGSVTSNGATLTVNAATPAGNEILFPYVTGLTFDGSGRLYASDSANDTIQQIGLDGAVTLIAGSNGNAGSSNGSGVSARFNQPGGLVATSNGIIYVADTANATIRRISMDGSVTTLAGSTTSRGNADGFGTNATFSAPTGIALDSAGNLYVADAMNNTIRKITVSGVVSTLAGSPGMSGAADGTGTSAQFNHPSDVVVDTADNTIFVADTTNNTIRRITPAGVVSTFAGVAGVSGSEDGHEEKALFSQPSGLALDLAGNLYVADTGNSTVRMITPDGTVSTLAGLPTISGEEDSDGNDSEGSSDSDTTAWFNHPLTIAVDVNGAVYVGDTGNASIRKISTDGSVSTLTLSTFNANASSAGGSTVTTGSSESTGSSAVASTNASSGGGGGAPSLWFVFGLLLLYGLRRRNLLTSQQKSYR